MGAVAGAAHSGTSWRLFLKCRIIDFLVSAGLANYKTASSAVVPPRENTKLAIATHAALCLVVHHPSNIVSKLVDNRHSFHKKSRAMHLDGVHAVLNAALLCHLRHILLTLMLQASKE
jgi:hypothetical protein